MGTIATIGGTCGKTARSTDVETNSCCHRERSGLWPGL